MTSGPDLSKLEAALSDGALVGRWPSRAPRRPTTSSRCSGGPAARWYLVPRGAGTGLSGGSTAVDGGIVLSFERMRAVVIDPAMRVAFAQALAMNADVKRAAAEHGL